MKHQGRLSLLVYNFREPQKFLREGPTMLLEFEWVCVGALVPADGMHEKKHRLNFRLDFRIQHHHLLHLKQTLGEGGKMYIFRHNGANGTLACSCSGMFADL